MYHSCTVRGKAQKFPASLAEFVPFGDEELKYIFSRDLCVGENTSRPASVNLPVFDGQTLRAAGCNFLFEWLCHSKRKNKSGPKAALVKQLKLVVDDVDNNAGANGAAALTDSEAQALLDGDGGD